MIANKRTDLHVQVRQLADPAGAKFVRTAVAITNLSEQRRNPMIVWQDLNLGPNLLEDGKGLAYHHTATNVAAHGTKFVEHRAAVVRSICFSAAHVCLGFCSVLPHVLEQTRATFPTTDKKILGDLSIAAAWSPSGA